MNRDRQSLPAAAFDRHYRLWWQWWHTEPRPGELEYLGGMHSRMRTDPKPDQRRDVP